MAEKKFLVPKDKLIDTQGRPLTSGLFIESKDPKFAVYTLKDHDATVDGVKYPSLKRLYLELEDPVEYTFVKEHLYNFRQWERMCENSELSLHINEWRRELDLKLASSAVAGILEIATDELASGQLQALKFFAKSEYKTTKNPVGRPKREPKEKPEEDFGFSSEIIKLQDRIRRIQ